MNANTFSFEVCMDIFDRYNDPAFEYINNILLCKLDGEERVQRALPSLQKLALELVNAHRNSENAYVLESA